MGEVWGGGVYTGYTGVCHVKMSHCMGANAARTKHPQITKEENGGRHRNRETEKERESERGERNVCKSEREKRWRGIKRGGSERQGKSWRRK